MEAKKCLRAVITNLDEAQTDAIHDTLQECSGEEIKKGGGFSKSYSI